MTSIRCWDEGKQRAKATEPQAEGWVDGTTLLPRGAGKEMQTWRKENVLDWMCWGFYRAEVGDGWGLEERREAGERLVVEGVWLGSLC